MKKLIVVSVLAVFLMSSMASAVIETVWVGGAGNWSDVANWERTDDNGTPLDPLDDVVTNALPTTDGRTKVTVALADIQVDGSYVAGNQFRFGTNSSNPGALLTIKSGGHLYTATGAGGETAKTMIGQSADAQMDIEAGGIYTAAHRFYLGDNAGATGTVNVAGTLNVELNNIYIGAGGVGELNVLDGGVLNVKAFGGAWVHDVAGGSTVSIFGNGVINGLDTALGNANGKIAAGGFYGNGILGNVEAVMIDGHAAIVALPEPATMILLGLGGLLLRKRR